MISKQQGIDALKSARDATVEGRKSSFRRTLAIIATLLAISILIQYFQLRKSPAANFGSSTFLLFGFVTYLVNQLIIFGGGRLAFVGVVNLGSLFFVAGFIGIVNPIIDGAILLAASIAAYLISRWKSLEPRTDTPRIRELFIFAWHRARWPIVVSLVFWLTLSVGVGISDFVRDKRAATARATRLNTRAFDSRLGDTLRLRIGVALSGGGYRAALMHAGVLHMIDSLGVPVRAMSTVSGGSIVGAHYVLGGEPSQFLEAAINKRISLARRIFRPFTFARLVAFTRYGSSDFFVLPFGDYNRTHVQAELLDEVFYEKAKHRHEGDAEPQIELMLCMTDIVNSAMIGVTPHGYLEQVVSPPTARFNFIARGQPSELGGFRRDDQQALPGTSNLATLVAASGAFPGAFKPLRVTLVNQLGAGEQLDTVNMVLADGGMADNLGLVLLYSARNLVRNNQITNASNASRSSIDAIRRWDVNFVIASDGSAQSAPVIPSSGIEEVGSSINLVSRASAGERLAGMSENPITILLSPDQFHGRNKGRLVANLEFRWDVGSDTVRQDPRAPPVQEPSFMTLEPRDLEFLVSSMDSTTVPRDSLMKAVRFITQRNGRESGTNSLDRMRNRSWADTVVWQAVKTDLADVITVFVETSTLTGDFDRHGAEALYRLGQYLFLFNRPLMVYSARYAQARETMPTMAAMQAGVPRPVKARPMLQMDSQRVRPLRYRK